MTVASDEAPKPVYITVEADGKVNCTVGGENVDVKDLLAQFQAEDQGDA